LQGNIAALDMALHWAGTVGIVTGTKRAAASQGD